jgi:hypothetical protein
MAPELLASVVLEGNADRSFGVNLSVHLAIRVEVADPDDLPFFSVFLGLPLGHRAESPHLRRE